MNAQQNIHKIAF